VDVCVRFNAVAHISSRRHIEDGIPLLILPLHHTLLTLLTRWLTPLNQQFLSQHPIIASFFISPSLQQKKKAQWRTRKRDCEFKECKALPFYPT
jgi:hypothetical protein